MTADMLWIYREISDEYIERLAEEAGVSPLAARVCANRGMRKAEEILSFMNPSISRLHDPFLLNDMDKAVERISKAIKNKEKIVIYGDYDVDGVTSTSILCRFFSSLNINVEFYIPDRVDEGYGISMAAADKIIQRGASLVITVDCGITAWREIEYFKDNGIDVVVTDHHECKECLPEAYAVINPCRPDSTYPFRELAGVGVAFKLVNALCIYLGMSQEHLKYLDLTALGTVADIVPLVDENRIIVSHGIKSIANTENVGLKALIEGSGIKDRKIDTYAISFILAPRINVAGRMGDAGRAVELFTTGDVDKANAIVKALNEDNRLRQDTESHIFNELVELIDGGSEIKSDKVIVASGDGWHHGVIGIVASKITEKYNRPCILISCEDGMGKGSGRSTEDFNLFKALGFCESVLEQYGGHEMAAGLTIRAENIGELRRLLNEYADSFPEGLEPASRLKIDAYLARNDITIEIAEELNRLAPFGEGNPVPVFAYKALRLDDVRTVGDNRHLKLRLCDRDSSFDAIGFNMGGMADLICRDELIDTAFSLEINTWNNISKVQLNLKDIRKNSAIALENEYYYTLNRLLDRLSDRLESGFMKKAGNGLLPEWCKTAGSPGDIAEEALNCGKRAALVLNSYESLWEVEKVVNRFGIDIINCIKICYTCSCTDNWDRMSILINPVPEEVEFNAFDIILFLGGWVSWDYFSELVNKAEGKEVYCFNNNFENGALNEAAAIGRDDLAAVYRYIRCGFNGKLDIKDPFEYARRIGCSNKISMNYLKLMKSLEIFQELGLLTVKPIEGNGISVVLPDNGKGRVDLEDSALYRKIQILYNK